MAEHTALRVDESNAGQLQAWDGDTGDFWAAHAQRIDDGVAGYREKFLTTAAIGDAEQVLDIGCGAGQTSRDAARCAPGGSVLGVDLSLSMIELARRLARREQLANAQFQQADAAIHPFAEGCFDLAISRHGAMFFGDPLAAFANLARALRPGGRLVLLSWQAFDANEFISTFRTILAAGRDVPAPRAGMPGPFAHADPDRVRALLTSAGFTDVRLDGLREPMYFGSDVTDAVEFVTAQHAALLADLDPDSRASALRQLRASMAAHSGERGVHYGSAAWLIQARRG
ncbi:MAG: class I SAM-dependent methyltransferase [Sciscionella sp.]